MLFNIFRRKTVLSRCMKTKHTSEQGNRLDVTSPRTCFYVNLSLGSSYRRSHFPVWIPHIFEQVIIHEVEQHVIDRKSQQIDFLKLFIQHGSIKEWVSFFLGMNRSTGQTNRVNCEAVLGRFVCSALRFSLIPYIYNVSNQGPFLKFLEKSYKFKIPTVTGS